MKTKLLFRFIMVILASFTYVLSIYTWLNYCDMNISPDSSININTII